MKKYLTRAQVFCSILCFFSSWQSCCVRDASAFSPAPRFPGVAVAAGRSLPSTRKGRRPRIGRTSAGHRPLRGSSRDDGGRDDADERRPDQSRRRLLVASLASWGWGAGGRPARAGLLTFPCDLVNRYHFMRAGLSELEADGIYSTNALFLTNRDNAMVTNDDGATVRSVVDACRVIEESGDAPTRVFHSLAANGMDTGDLLARTLQLGRDRLLPEFTYLDQRGIGLWDSSDYARTKKAVMAMDYYEAGRDGVRGRPPANEDGTPNETLQDQFVRLRQFLSLQESRTSGENILVIFPDGTGPALLSCMIAGIPLNKCHCLDYAPGEVRLNVDRRSVMEQYEARKDDPGYLADLEEGREILVAIRREGSADALNVKDQRAEADRAAADEAYLRSKERQLEEDRARREQLERAREEARREKEESERASLEAAREARERREEQERQRREQLQRARAEREERRREELELVRREREDGRGVAGSVAVSASPSPDAKSSPGGSPVVGIAGGIVAGLGAAVALAMGGDNEDLGGPTVKTDTEPGAPSAAETSKEETSSISTNVSANVNATRFDATVAVNVDANSNLTKAEMGLGGTLSGSNAIAAAAMVGHVGAANGAATSTASPSLPSLTKGAASPAADDGAIQTKEEDKEDALGARKIDGDGIKEVLDQIEAADDVYFDTAGEGEMSSKRNGHRIEHPMLQQGDVAAESSRQRARVEVATGIAVEEEYVEDSDYYDSSWLRQIAEIRDEED